MILDSKTISNFSEKFSDVIQINIWNQMSSKELFSLIGLGETIGPEKKSFDFIAKIILSRRGKEAYPYQIGLLKMLSQIKNTKMRNALLDVDFKSDSDTLIKRIQTLTKEMQGEVVFYGEVLCAQYSGFKPLFSKKARDSLANLGALKPFSVFFASGSEILSKKLTHYYDRYVSEAYPSADRIFDIIIKNRDLSSCTQILAWKALTAFIATPAALAKIDQIFDLVIERLGQVSDLSHGSVLKAFNAIIKTGAVSHKAEKIFDFIVKILAHNSMFQVGPVFEALMKAWIALVKVPDTFNKIGEIFFLVTEKLSKKLGRSKRALLWGALDAIVAKAVTLNKIDEVFSKLTEKGVILEAGRVYGFILEALTDCIKRSPGLKKPEEILAFILKNLKHPSSQAIGAASEALIAFIKMPAALDDMDKILDSITKNLDDYSENLNHHSDTVSTGLKALPAIIMTPAVEYNSDKILKLISKGLTKNSYFVQETSLEALKIFIETETPAVEYNSHKILKLIFEGLTKENYFIKSAALGVLTAFMKVPIALDNIDEILKLLAVKNLSWEIQRAEINKIMVAGAGAPAVDLKDQSSTIQKSILEILIAFMKKPADKVTSADFSNLDKIFDFITKKLNQDSGAEAAAPLNITDEIFSLTTKQFGYYSGSIQEAVLEIMASYMKAPWADYSISEILGFFREGLGTSKWSQEAELEALITFMGKSDYIETAPFFNSVNSIFELLIKILGHDLEVKTAVASKKIDEIFNLVAEKYNSSSGQAHNSVLKTSPVMKLGLLNKADKILDLVEESLDSSSGSGLKALILLIQTSAVPLNAEKIFLIIRKSFNEKELIVKQAALELLVFCMNKKMLVPIDFWKQGLAAVQQIMGDTSYDKAGYADMRAVSMSALTTLIKYYPAIDPEKKEDLGESQDMVNFLHSLALNSNDNLIRYDEVLVEHPSNEKQASSSEIVDLRENHEAVALSAKPEKSLLEDAPVVENLTENSNEKLIESEPESSMPVEQCLGEKVEALNSNEDLIRYDEILVEHPSNEKQASSSEIVDLRENHEAVALSAKPEKSLLEDAPAVENLTESSNKKLIESEPEAVFSASSIPVEQCLGEKVEALIKKHSFNGYSAKEKMALLEGLVKEVDRLETIAEISCIFDICSKKLNVFNAHKNPTLDKVLGINNTKHWVRCVKTIKEKGLLKLFQEVDAESDFQKKIERLEWAKSQRIFNVHTNDSILKGAFGNTATVNKIDKKICDLKLEKSKNLSSSRKSDSALLTERRFCHRR